VRYVDGAYGSMSMGETDPQLDIHAAIGGSLMEFFGISNPVA
jgi:hypothetical protein